MVTFTLREAGALARVYDRLRLPKGPSFGMKTTLVCPFMYLAHYDLVTTEAGRARLVADGLDPDLLRLCVGTEPVDEIIGALAEALGLGARRCGTRPCGASIGLACATCEHADGASLRNAAQERVLSDGEAFLRHVETERGPARGSRRARGTEAWELAYRLIAPPAGSVRPLPASKSRGSMSPDVDAGWMTCATARGGYRLPVRADELARVFVTDALALLFPHFASHRRAIAPACAPSSTASRHRSRSSSTASVTRTPPIPRRS